MATQTVPKCLEMPRFQPQKAPEHRLRQRIWKREGRTFPVSIPRNLQHDPCYMKTSILIREVAVCVGEYLRSPESSGTPSPAGDLEAGEPMATCRELPEKMPAELIVKSGHRMAF